MPLVWLSKPHLLLAQPPRRTPRQSHARLQRGSVRAKHVTRHRKEAQFSPCPAYPIYPISPICPISPYAARRVSAVNGFSASVDSAGGARLEPPAAAVSGGGAGEAATAAFVSAALSSASARVLLRFIISMNGE